MFVVQYTQSLGAQDFIGRVGMSIFDIPSIGGREEINGLASGELFQVIIKIASLFQVIKQADKISALSDKEGGDEHSRCGAIYSA